MYKKRSRKSFSKRKGNSYPSHLRRKKIKEFDPRDIVEKSEKEATETYEIKNTFDDFQMSQKLKNAIKRRGYETPTPIQDRAIPEILKGRDVVGIANTGTGKTGAFLIPLINKVIHERPSRVLIIAPTRELALQIEKEFKIFSEDTRMYSTVCIGGVSLKGQVNSLQRKPNFVIGTPGRLLDLHKQGKLRFSEFESIVLDEVDRMLDMGFIHDMNKIISKLPQRRQSLFFSATLDKKVEKVMRRFIYKPVMISVKTADTSENVTQEVIKLGGRNKVDVLIQLLDDGDLPKTLIFTRTKWNADKLARVLNKYGFRALVMHGNKSQNHRQRSLESFKKGEVDLLIATDVASRGIDIDDITHVINFDLPESQDAYVHRIGRTGRADKKGVALTFVD